MIKAYFADGYVQVFNDAIFCYTGNIIVYRGAFRMLSNESRKSRKRINKILLITGAVIFVLLILTAPGTSLVEKAALILESINDTEVIDTYKYTSKTMEAEVTSVIDGDTFRIRTEEGNTDKVRLLLIDTPEIGDKPEPYALEARDYTEVLLAGQTVHLECDESERDQYGRLLAYAYVDDQMVNELLLEQGLARVAVFPPDTRYVDDFREIETKARESRLRVWSIDNYVTNRGFNADAAAQK
ncbi:MULTISPECIES: thermonuclease family protein [unclassified Paenibacillus]|uniref:thermonuclease family protein n=1 Tax=unclassified Paenibacillus TaxID=185978 RepID=UPI0024057A4B|nr:MULTISPECIES: thermonuclease family protein [unclassified Paenibacillus]MDF9839209.1 endonuclease YncB(thermonuclease family) [Paenibacillus sp. PastF-2]MDF9845790.1 endonuclease YncB(thermonuclease family) [Paenibacillus sp. PastM-2]MDF9852363.1 endonuclease YncB(thermonuclease family) [Paenibacillus sp. PastF-1]MDH6477907.1 endonuclease YncB(thermonuclease family) [Paenibacillus sp. PastH-2]MDH6505646.1 endonuclease YncB(thermonuclease family) [Paenibacillus sp. PastM-3]